MVDPVLHGQADTPRPGNGPDDKRRDGRVSYDLPVFFYFATGKRKPRDVQYHKGYTQDVSKNGIRLLIERPSPETAERIAVGAELEMEIYLPAVFRSKPITVRGRIVRCVPDPESGEGNLMIGIDFMSLDDRSRETLKQVAATLRDLTDDILGGEGTTEGDELPPAIEG